MKHLSILLLCMLSAVLHAQQPITTKPSINPQLPGVQRLPSTQKVAPIKGQTAPASQANNNSVMEGSINTQPFQRFGGNRPIFQELKGATQQLEQSITLFNQANQAFNAKTRQCFPPGNTLTIDQQRQASCRRGETVEQCYTKYMELCTRREKASLDAAATVMYQDGKRVKDMLQGNTRFR